MKKLFFIIAACIFALPMMAQPDSIADKMAALESRLVVLQQTMVHMQKQVDEVTRQNLSLKHALDLRKPITEATTESGINFRLISAVGDSINHKVTLLFSVVNTHPEDEYCKMSTTSFIDDKGNQYSDMDFHNTTLGTEFIINGCFVIPQTPINMTIVFPGVSTDAEYIKTFNVRSGFHKGSFHLHDIPIKWE